MSGYDIEGRARALYYEETAGRAPAGFAHYYPVWGLLSEVERSRYRERVITPPEDPPRGFTIGRDGTPRFPGMPIL